MANLHFLGQYKRELNKGADKNLDDKIQKKYMAKVNCKTTLTLQFLDLFLVKVIVIVIVW